MHALLNKKSCRINVTQVFIAGSVDNEEDDTDDAYPGHNDSSGHGRPPLTAGG